MNKVAKQHVLQKNCKCSHFEVIRNLLKVATSAIIDLAMNWNQEKQQNVFQEKTEQPLI